METLKFVNLVTSRKLLQSSEFGLKMAKPAFTPLPLGYYRNQTEEEELLPDNNNYRKMIGHLLYLSVKSRPDITSSVCILAQTDYAEDLNTRKSNSGQVFFLNGGCISWSCRKQNIVTLSSTEAEFVALPDACKELLWLRKLLRDMHQEVDEPTIVYEDNQSCLDFITREKFSIRMKHVDTTAHFVKHYVDNGIVHCVWSPTDERIADLLTKPLPVSKHAKFRKAIGLTD